MDTVPIREHDVRRGRQGWMSLSILALSVILLTGVGLQWLSAEGVVPVWVSVIALAVISSGAVLVGISIHRAATVRFRSAAKDPGQVLRERLAQVNEAFGEAASLMDDLRRDLEAQQTAREELVAQAEEHQRLLAVDEERAEKIRQILVGETKEAIRAEGRKQWMFFALGVVTSIPIGVAINLFVR